MPTSLWSTCRDEISRPLGFVSFISTETTTTTVVCAALENQFDQDDYFIGWYLLFTAGDNAGAIRRISDYAANGGTLTHQGVNLGTVETANRACTLHRFHPAEIQRAYNRARQNVFPAIYVPQEYLGLTTGHQQHRYTLPTSLRNGPISVELGYRVGAKNIPENVLSNPDFEDWTSTTALDDWAVAGSGASENQEKQTTDPPNYGVLADDNALRLAVAASTATTELQTVDLTASGKIAFEGMEVNLSIWVYTRLTSRVRARIVGTGVSSTPVSGDYHQGTGWEQLTVTAILDGTNNTFDVGVAVESGAATSIYVDEAICTVGQTEAVGRGWEPLLNWQWLPPGSASNGGTLLFDTPLPALIGLRILGKGMLSSVSADSDTVELDGELLEPVYNKVREYLCEERASEGPLDERSMWIARANDFADAYEIAVNSDVRIGSPRKRFKVPDMVI